jgi:tRNA threonylcarbamoyl adenosine modification protein YjeE
LELPDRAATDALAVRLAAGARAGDVLALVGPLGVGKTTLVRALVVALGGDGQEVVSPTFTLVQHYVARLPVAHVDAYRLHSDAALRALGHEELFPADADGTPCGLSVFEWADLVRDSMPAGAVWIEMGPGLGERRTVHASGPPETLVRLGLTPESRESRPSEAAS